MPLTKSIFPFWYAFALPIHSTKIDILIRNIFVMTSAIIISILDIHRIHTNNIAIMLIIQRFYGKHFIEFFFYQLSTIIGILIFKKDFIKVKHLMQSQFHFFVVFFYKPN